MSTGLVMSASGRKQSHAFESHMTTLRLTKHYCDIFFPDHTLTVSMKARRRRRPILPRALDLHFANFITHNAKRTSTPLVLPHPQTAYSCCRTPGSYAMGGQDAIA